VEKEAEEILKSWEFHPEALEAWRKANVDHIFPDY
jgi:hypothetical protein